MRQVAATGGEGPGPSRGERGEPPAPEKERTAIGQPLADLVPPNATSVVARAAPEAECRTTTTAEVERDVREWIGFAPDEGLA
ncbi:MAG: hypothetical protein AVDCRST_MAG19-4645 [uncultured Thermomicrobiales bacterium]|uniref:Uncharacterized protein n=1 Tax=uncultured Thermomicrobiales bacterium TaxID=1645740 RepID=A0A6J4VV93_9BACT|nr:MAG: hypothetical protein AVDCRST_MAG19-4645 [uncultured Thermomicrobiales bacterium]